MKTIKEFHVQPSDDAFSFTAPLGGEVVSVRPDVNKLNELVVHLLVDDSEPTMTYNMRIFQADSEVRGRYVASYRGYDLKFRHVFIF